MLIRNRHVYKSQKVEKITCQNNVDNININSKTIFSYIKNITYYSHKVRDSMQSTQPNSIQ